MSRDPSLDPTTIIVQRPYGGAVAGLAFPHRNSLVALAVLLSVAMLVIAGATPYSRTVSAQGLTAFVSGSAQIAAPQPGVVAIVHVREGDLVAEGAALVTLDLHKYGATGPALDQQLSALFKNQRDLLQEQIAAETDRAQLAADRFAAKKTEMADQIEVLSRQMQLQDDLVTLDTAAVRSVQELRQKGYITAVELDHREETLLVARQRLADLHRQQIGAQSELSDAEATAKETGRQTVESVARLKAAIADIDQQMARADAEGRLILRAPIAGRVALVSLQPGQQADPSQPVLTIVPVDKPLEIKLFVPSRAAGILKAGQTARLAFDAFPYQDFGFLFGTVSEVSTVGANPELGRPSREDREPLFRVTVSLPKQAIGHHDRVFPLTPDMRVSARVIVERKSVFGWAAAAIRQLLPAGAQA